ncbi:Glycosyltransferase Family 48 protein [Trametes cinnabarina]|uniref:1,3-beta-glucan synthase n=1 Tax=Pycnoporus cinnabarinus TaxID=5643 RepID=A0A060S7G4_PYCCI|nr:Glycosyltransferase Family 48 protein [Trametes cinnabarina]
MHPIYRPVHDASSTDSVAVHPYYHSNDSSGPSSEENHEHVPILTYTAPAGDETSFPGYGKHYSASVESHTSTGTSIAPSNPFADLPGSSEPYPAWSADRQIPMSTEEIEDIFLDLAQKFGFQKDSMRNMFDFLMTLLDSRASRMSPNQALLTVHADYIGGQHANYRKWYFAAQLNLDDAVGQSQNPGLQRLRSVKGNVKTASTKSLDSALNRWRNAMNNMSQYDRLRQVALYLLCWGEAGNVRFTPECLCFIFKCADDYYRSPECQNRVDPVPEGLYLETVIKPLYRFMRDQGYEVVEGKFVRREKDHDQIIGYDDINQLFWYPEGLAKIVLQDNTRLIDVPPAQRFTKFGRIAWNRVFFKTYFEKRSRAHLLVNFNRIWILHVAVYWFYTAFNSPKVYAPKNKQHPSPAMTWSATALGGAVATLIMIAATLAEFSYIPTSWHNAGHLTTRLVFLLVVLALTGGPTFYIAIVDDRPGQGNIPLIIGIAQFFISVVATLAFSIIPSGRMFGDRVRGKSRKYLASQTFTASYPTLGRTARLASISIWLLIFGCKFAESYFFLTSSFSSPIAVMARTKVQGCNDKYFGNALCSNQVPFALAIMYVMDLILFFLDTYLWYIIWIVVFSVARSFHLGLSIWTPWKEVYTRMPKRIYAKLLATSEMEVKYKPKVLVSQVWNAIIISMYREHLLSIHHVQRLLYHQVDGPDGRRTLRAPPFFTNNTGNESDFFPSGGEAERRISFFASSLTTAVPEPLPVESMPTFTVLVPHYSEKILLSLREIIREEDQNTRVTLLEYLKQLHPIEWDNFVKDTKILAEESETASTFDGTASTNEKASNKRTDDLPFYCIGFKTAAPEYTLRTRIWASLRAQTLYRTVSGMMNYSKAIKLLYRVENPQIVQRFAGNTDRLERELERMSRRKFKFTVSMQRYAKFNKEELENAEFLLRAYPDLQIAYLDEEPGPQGGDPRLFSVLIDGHSEIDERTGKRKPKFRVELPGNPILGDGKSDNQNHAIIFYRGEYLQLIDANQDNYLEECLKIRNILGEFEQYTVSSQSPYAQWGHKEFSQFPVAIVGTREYIFSENIGVLGDIAAGKEQTFGTLTPRVLAWIGGKLHYGHPDFLNAIFMTTRGGVSKAQKGLHLNEDIFAGMTAISRGGRIKHSEYYQCGKGRDLGFGTILNFQTKLGTGMGEQMLSREYYYLGTQLPMDRFLTFYYGHPGFHINNILVIYSIQTFMITLLYLGTLNKQLAICKVDSQGNVLGGQPGCYNLIPVFDWIKHCIVSIFLVFFIAFLPLFMQELLERGTGKALIRLGKHFLSLSPIFEVFSTQIYSQSILSNLTFGGARYIATGRGFATTRISFTILYSRFAGPSIYMGMRNLLLLLYATMSIWTPFLMYFWVSVLSLCVAPFLFNPHQFSFADFIIDYREFLRWMSRGNSRAKASSWYGYCRLSRTMITGYKKKKLGHPSEKLAGDVPRAKWRSVLFSEIIFPICGAILFIVAYMFVKSFPDRNGNPNPSPLIRIAVIAVGPVVWNATVLLSLFFVSLFLGPMMESWARFPAFMAALAHFLALIGLIAFFEFFWFLELWDASHAVLGVIAIIAIQRAIQKILISVFLSRELKHEETNRAWWSGKWYGRGLGSSAFSQPAREFVVKIVEMSLWTSDFLLAHLLLIVMTPPMFIPFVDKLHSMMMFWLRPSKQIRPPLFSTKQKRQRRWIVLKYTLVYIIVVAFLAALLILPCSTLHAATTVENNYGNMNQARGVLVRLKQKLRGQGNPSAAKIRRQRALRDSIWRGLPLTRLLLFTVGYIWLLVIPSSQLGQGTYIDENALQPGQVNTYWNWGEVHHADRILENLEQLRDRNATHDEIARFVVTEFEKYGIPARTQRYSFDSTTINGTNAYGVLQAPRASGTEAIVISASWLSRTGEGDGTLNLRGVSTVLALAKYLKKYSLWAKDLVFVISDGYLDGMQAWISTYHGETQPNLKADPLSLQSGVIWTALNIDYPGHSFSHLGIFFEEGLNGRLPNQDLTNSVSLIARYTVGVPTLVYDHIDPRDDSNQPGLLPSWLPETLKKNGDVQEFRIDAITLFAVPATGPHGFHALGRIMESSLRTCNNLLERLHASFFFYLLVAPGTFMKIGSYLPSAILVGTAMLFTGLGEWVNAGWVLSPMATASKEGGQVATIGDRKKWRSRHRPVLEPVAIMVLTHLIGVILFLLVSTSWFATNQKVAGLLLYFLFAVIPLVASAFAPTAPSLHAPIPFVLKAFNLCFASAIVSITSVLNFSLAATLAIFLGLPLTLASPSTPSSSFSVRVGKYAAYTFLASAWLVLCPEETRQAIWNWEVLRVWFAPFVCVVYVPLVLQAGLVCLLPA